MNETKPKVRLQKRTDPHAKLKSGVLIIKEGESTRYRCDCDRCGEEFTMNRPPTKDRPVLCHHCFAVARQARPGVEVVRQKGKVLYKSPCDACGQEEVVPFVPKSGIPFFCNRCLREKKPVDPGQKSLKEHKHPPRKVISLKNGHFQVKCDRCKVWKEVAFQPPQDQPFLCSDCYENRKKGSPRKKIVSEDAGDRPVTRVFFRLECAACGKTEEVDYLPANPNQAMCRACAAEQKKNQRQKRRDQE
jgi:CxxC-x17-CxxC domain-containing protein